MPVNMFQPYQSQQVAPVPPGYLESFNQVGRNYGQGISAMGEGLAQGMKDWRQIHQQGKAAEMFVKSYDAKGPDGKTANPILDQMGVHRDAFDTLGSRDKMAIVSGFMQSSAAKSQQADQQAQAQERQARAVMLQQQGDEADAMGKIAPVAQQWQAQNPGKQPGAADILQWMGAAKLNPRTQGTILQKLIPAMMNGENGGGWNFDPSKVTDLSDKGLPGAFFVPTSKGGGVIQHAGAPADENATPEGYTTVLDGKGGVKYLRTPGAKTVPPSAQNQLTQYLNDFSSAQDVLNSSDEELKNNPAGLPPAQLKASAQARLKRVQTNAQNLLNMQHKLGALDDGTHADLMSQFGLGKAPASGGGAAAAGDRITVYKDGKPFTVPASQKDDAVKAGYSLTQ